MRGSAAFRVAVAPGGALTGPWVRDPLWTRARAVPSLDLRFADNKSLVDAVTGAQLVTFTRASSGTFVGSDGVLRTAVTNLILRSEKLDDAAQWNVIGSGATLTATTDVAAPNGAMTAWTFTSSGAAAQIQQAPTGISGATYTGSFYIRRRSGTGTVNIRVSENINTPLAGVTSEWQRFSFTATSTSTTIRLGVNLSGIADAVDLWGAQLEQSATVGEYIPTTSAINSAPRFDHSITSTTTNLLLQSNGFDTTWTNTNSSETSLSGTAPDGTNTAWELKDTSDVSSVVHALNQSVSFISGTAYTVSCWMKAGVLTEGGFTFPAGAFTSNISARVSLSTGVVITTSAGVTASTQQFSNGWWRVSATATATATASAAMQIRIMNGGFAYIGTGTGTILIYGAQLETGSTATPYVPTTTAAATSNTTDSLGLLVEEARTNSIRNNTMVGAVAGTPGTIPTNWTGSGTTSGITREIVGTGIENGINYIDYRIAGTTTGALFFGVSPEVSNSVAATNGQTWTFSSYARLIAGSLAGFTSINFYIVFNSSIGAGLQFVTGGITPTSAALNTQRFTRTGTASNALIAFVQPSIQFEAPTGTSIDITIRIGLPQLEQGAFATSPIPTTTATVTRAADVASITGSNFSSWYNQTEGTVFAEMDRNTAISTTSTVVSINDNSANNRLYNFRQDSASALTVINVTGGTLDGASVVTLANTSNRNRVAAAQSLNNLAAVANGGTVVPDTSVAMPTVNQLQIGNVIGSSYFNGTIKRLTFWPTRLATLQAITQP